MKNDSKSGLKISQVLTILSCFIILATSTQLLSFGKNEQTNDENLTNIQLEQIHAETQIAEKENTEDVLQRDIQVTSRGEAQRNTIQNQEEVKEQYISINEIKISRNMDLTKRCGISKEDFKKLMKDLKPDTTDFFYNNSDTIYELCKKYELNEIFFCGLIAAESGWKINSNHRSTCNYISMMSKGKLIRYSTPEQGLEAAAKLLHQKYLTPGGAYYSGKTLANVQKIFCPGSSTWVGLVYGCMNVIV